jgi:hypothetical protein
VKNEISGFSVSLHIASGYYQRSTIEGTMIIAERTLEIRLLGEATVSVPIKLFAPSEDATGWYCRYSIGWPEANRSMAIYGVDGMQAIILAMQVIGTELYASKHHENGTLVFHDFGNGYGFPVASAMRDLLIGDDKTFWG